MPHGQRAAWHLVPSHGALSSGLAAHAPHGPVGRLRRRGATATTSDTWTPAQVREFGDISRRPWMFTSFTIAGKTFRTNLVIAVNRRRSSQQIQQGVTAVEALRERELAHTVIANQLHAGDYVPTGLGTRTAADHPQRCN
eukprot:COSAG01_NODE_495_length_16308_cov_92.317088_15_plen_140_part_00